MHCKAMLKSQEKLSANESAKNCRILPDRKNCNPFPKIQTFCLKSKCKHCLVLSFFFKLKTKPIYMKSRLSRALLPSATLQICTVFNCVPLSTVISLYGLHLIDRTVRLQWKLGHNLKTIKITLNCLKYTVQS